MQQINMCRNKKAQIGATMTWMLAFVIIFFIMVVFAVISVVFSVKKVVMPTDVLFNTEANEIVVGTSTELSSLDYGLSRNLLVFLESYVKDKGYMYDLIGIYVNSGQEEISNSIQENAVKYFDSQYGKSCYHICLMAIKDGKSNNIMEISGKECSISERIGLDLENNCDDLLINAGKSMYLHADYVSDGEFSIEIYKKVIGVKIDE